LCESLAPTDFPRGSAGSEISPDKGIPHVTPEVIVKYITDLRLLGLL